jgi:hypothetical protein
MAKALQPSSSASNSTGRCVTAPPTPPEGEIEMEFIQNIDWQPMLEFAADIAVILAVMAVPMFIFDIANDFIPESVIKRIQLYGFWAFMITLVIVGIIEGM